MDWVSQMRGSMPEVAIRTQTGFSDTLMQHLVAGTLDIGVMYTPQGRPGFELEMLFEEELVLVSSVPEPSVKPSKHYIYVDWGPEFQADHSLNRPDLTTPGLYMELGSLSLPFLLQNPASGYFPKRLVTPFLEGETLRLVKQAPVFHYPAYVVYPADGDEAVFGPALALMRTVAASHATA